MHGNPPTPATVVGLHRGKGERRYQGRMPTVPERESRRPMRLGWARPGSGPVCATSCDRPLRSGPALCAGPFLCSAHLALPPAWSGSNGRATDPLPDLRQRTPSDMIGHSFPTLEEKPYNSTMNKNRIIPTVGISVLVPLALWVWAQSPRPGAEARAEGPSVAAAPASTTSASAPPAAAAPAAAPAHGAAGRAADRGRADPGRGRQEGRCASRRSRPSWSRRSRCSSRSSRSTGSTARLPAGGSSSSWWSRACPAHPAR